MKELIDKIIKIEGGYVNDLSDSGGRTRFGITEEVARINGYNGDMRYLPIDFAREIYKKDYFDPLRLVDVIIFPEVAERLMNIAVHAGVKRASIFFQRSLNVLNNKSIYFDDLLVDGIIGDKTILAFMNFVAKRREDGKHVLEKMLSSLQGNFYIELAEKREKDEKFIFGWFKNRL